MSLNEALYPSLNVTPFSRTPLLIDGLNLPSKDCVLHLPFGLNVKDLSIYKNDGVLHGATWVAGRVGKALNFDGATTYVDVPTSASLDIIDALTISVWCYKTANTGAYEMIVSKKESYELGLFPPIMFFYYDGGAWRSLSGLIAMPLNEWAHVAVTQEASGGNTLVTLYRNGALDNQGVVTGRPTSNLTNVSVGCGHVPPAYPWLGIIDEPRIYKRVLSAKEINAIYLGLA